MSHQPPLVAALGGKQGIVDGAVPPVAFVAANAVAGLLEADRPLAWAITLALASGSGTMALRALQGASVRGALRGLVGLGIALAFAAATGQARDFFLPGIVVDAVYAVGFAVSVIVGRPVVGYLHGVVFARCRDWRERPLLRRVFVMATLGWAGVFAVRAVVTAYLYAVDQPELLGLAKVGLGWPLTAVALTATLAAVRRVPDCPT